MNGVGAPPEGMRERRERGKIESLKESEKE